MLRPPGFVRVDATEMKGLRSSTGLAQGHEAWLPTTSRLYVLQDFCMQADAFSAVQGQWASMQVLEPLTTVSLTY